MAEKRRAEDITKNPYLHHAPLRNEGVFGTCDGPLYIKPHDDTYISETAFDVFSIKDNVMYITRFGAGEDRIATLLR